MSNSLAKSVDGFYGVKSGRPSFKPVAIQAGGYNPNFEQKEKIQASQEVQNEEQISENANNETVEQMDRGEFNQYVLSDWYQSLEENKEDVLAEENNDQETDSSSNSGNIKVHFIEAELPFIDQLKQENQSNFETDIAESANEDNANLFQTENQSMIESFNLTTEEKNRLHLLRNTPKINQKYALRF
jgi:hypothetical protein